jgi:hypothetical protein
LTQQSKSSPKPTAQSAGLNLSRVDGFCDPIVSWQESAVKELDAFRVEKGFADAVRGFDGDANDAEMR